MARAGQTGLFQVAKHFAWYVRCRNLVFRWEPFHGCRSESETLFWKIRCAISCRPKVSSGLRRSDPASGGPATCGTLGGVRPVPGRLVPVGMFGIPYRVPGGPSGRARAVQSDPVARTNRGLRAQPPRISVRRTEPAGVPPDAFPAGKLCPVAAPTAVCRNLRCNAIVCSM